MSSGLVSVISEFAPGIGPGTYRVWRRSSGDYVGGIYQAYDDVELDITEIQPGGTFVSVGHQLVTGQGPVYPSVVDPNNMPAGLTDGTPVWIIAVDDDTFMVATSRENALTESPWEVGGLGEGVTLHLENSFMCEMAIFPESGRVDNAQEETDETEESRLAFSLTKLYTQEPGFDEDVVEIDGELWSVDMSKRWQGFGETAYEMTLSRIDVP